MEAGQRLTGDGVVRILEQVSLSEAYPERFTWTTVRSLYLVLWICGRTGTKYSWITGVLETQPAMQSLSHSMEQCVTSA